MQPPRKGRREREGRRAGGREGGREGGRVTEGGRVKEGGEGGGGSRASGIKRERRGSIDAPNLSCGRLELETLINIPHSLDEGV